MKIRQRRNGEWCMEHNGVEAPYDVEKERGEAFSVYDLEDEDREKPIAFHVDQDTAEALTRAHFKTIAGKLGLRGD
ncbi:hypothetical protein F9K91_02215 [Brucella tritici]|uniref:Uncharacterized protein n=1 Tax=Brucella tritici TaxID=94626 RepID=A0A7X6FQU3_9HYPH|nr:hypothetical protein [Brucella tritici]KAB2666774.1 hypothetical protein F9K91_02215 [Brucella tritici]NKW10265.1 hypothetical protein [Brucella tritici]